jgi:hypothetical protein
LQGPRRFLTRSCQKKGATPDSGVLDALVRQGECMKTSWPWHKQLLRLFRPLGSARRTKTHLSERSLGEGQPGPKQREGRCRIGSLRRNQRHGLCAIRPARRAETAPMLDRRVDARPDRSAGETPWSRWTRSDEARRLGRSRFLTRRPTARCSVDTVVVWTSRERPGDATRVGNLPGRRTRDSLASESSDECRGAEGQPAGRTCSGATCIDHRQGSASRGGNSKRGLIKSMAARQSRAACRRVWKRWLG